MRRSSESSLAVVMVGDSGMQTRPRDPVGAVVTSTDSWPFGSVVGFDSRANPERSECDYWVRAVSGWALRVRGRVGASDCGRGAGAARGPGRLRQVLGWADHLQPR